jgi:hypothetical protein
VIERQEKKHGYAISYVDGAYSASSYRGDTAYASSGIYSGETMTNKDAKSIVRNSVKVGAMANSTEASAWAEAETTATGTANSVTSTAATTAEAKAEAAIDGTASSSAKASFSASVGPKNAQAKNSRSNRTGAQTRGVVAAIRAGCGGQSTFEQAGCGNR